METIDTLSLTRATPLPRQHEGVNAPAPKICLVTALTIEDFLDPQLTASVQQRPPQLGIMTLAAILRANGFRPKIVNLDDLDLTFVNSCNYVPASSVQVEAGMEAPVPDNIRPSEAETPRFFIPFVLDHLEGELWDAAGLSSICSSYTVDFAAGAKKSSAYGPDAPLILGGPQASVVSYTSDDDEKPFHAWTLFFGARRIRHFRHCLKSWSPM